MSWAKVLLIPLGEASNRPDFGGLFGVLALRMGGRLGP